MRAAITEHRGDGASWPLKDLHYSIHSKHTHANMFLFSAACSWYASCKPTCNPLKTCIQAIIRCRWVNKHLHNAVMCSLIHKGHVFSMRMRVFALLRTHPSPCYTNSPSNHTRYCQCSCVYAVLKNEHLEVDSFFFLFFVFVMRGLIFISSLNIWNVWRVWECGEAVLSYCSFLHASLLFRPV